MRGEVSFDGIFVPTLLVLAFIAMLLAIPVIRLLNLTGMYRFVAYRALVDLCLYILILGLLAFLSPLVGIPL